MMFFFKKKSAQTITILPNDDLCPSGEVVPAMPGKSIVELLLENDVEISHSCQMQCACTTCHIYIIEGGQYISSMHNEEDRELKQLNDRQHWSRLGCQAIFTGGGNLTIEIRN